MPQPKVPQKAPYEHAVQPGRPYAWCACGLSKRQPFCDGSHTGTGIPPVVCTVEKEATVWFCGCKHTKSPPYCDGSHADL